MKEISFRERIASAKFNSNLDLYEDSLADRMEQVTANLSRKLIESDMKASSKKTPASNSYQTSQGQRLALAGNYFAKTQQSIATTS